MDDAMMERYAIAHRLGLTVEQLSQMALSEFVGWREYFRRVEGHRGR
jgi:hypothetical protein